MKCIRCGAENPDGAKYCSGCGEPMTVQQDNDFSAERTFAEEPTVNAGFGFREKLLSLLSPWILTLAILETASAVIGLANHDLAIFPILFAIFAWMFYAAGKKGTFDQKSIRRFAAVSRAQYILCLVVVCILGVVGVLAFVAAPFGDNLPENIYTYAEGELEFVEDFGSTAVLIVCGIVFLTIAAVILIFNLCGYKKIHKYLHSLAQSGETDIYAPEKPVQAGKWMLAFGILSAVGALIGGVDIGLISGGCTAAVYIIGYVIVNKLEGKQ